jgi:hypothetical protein
VALQQTTRELWASQGPFEPYTIHGITQQNVPAIYIKGAVWNAQAGPARYHARSSAPEESGIGNWFPIEFNEEHVCWVEVRLQEPPGSEPCWQAFRIAGEGMAGDSAACLSPSTNGAFEPSWDPQHDAPGPVYDLLIGRTAYFMALSQPALLCSGTLRPLMLRATIWQLSVILSLPGLCLAMCSHAALLHLQTHLGPGLWVLLHQVQVQTRPSWQTKSFLVERGRVPYYKLDIIKHLSLCCHLVTECKM